VASRFEIPGTVVLTPYDMRKPACLRFPVPWPTHGSSAQRIPSGSQR